MIADHFRILAPIFAAGRPRGVDPLLYSFLALGRVTKKPSYYARTNPERERRRTQLGVDLVNRLRKPQEEELSLVSLEDMKIPGIHGKIRLRLYAVADPSELLVFFHGGGWVVGSIGTAEHICERLADALHASILSVGYHLAPEYPFPAGLEDASTAIQWAMATAEELGVRPGCVSVAGTSAGANIAAAACLKLRDQGHSLPARQLLIYPPTDVAFLESESYRRYGNKKLGLSPAQMDWFRKNYVSNDDYANPYVSINRARDLSSLPPAVIATAEFDILRSEAEEYGRQLAAAGNRMKTVCAKGMVHGFLNFTEIVESASERLDEIVAEYLGLREGG